MAPKSRGRLTVPTTKPLQDHLRLPANSSHVVRTLSKLSRSSLLTLASEWCEGSNLKTCGPYIIGEDGEDDLDSAYPAATSLAEVEGLYNEELPARKGSKREVVDRILEGDWRYGVSMRQLAMAETRYVLDNQSANRWTALELKAQGEVDDNDHKDGQHLPRLHVASFVRSLQDEISPLAKAHFYMHQPKESPFMILRIYLHDTPYNTTTALRTVSTNGMSKKPNPSEAPKSIFILFPEGTAYIYVSLASSGAHLTDPESKSIQKFIVEAIPKALSRRGRRYELSPTAMNARSVTAMLAHRGAGKSNSAAGGWSVFVQDSKWHNALDFSKEPKNKTSYDGEDDSEADKENMPAHIVGKKRPFQHSDPTNNADPKTRKRLKLLAASRFGNYGKPEDEKNLHNFTVRITDSFDRRAKARKLGGDGFFVEETVEDRGTFKPDVRLSFQGQHVFAGFRMLVEKGVIDGERMPGWLTGEAAVSVGLVKHGRIEQAAKT